MAGLFPDFALKPKVKKFEPIDPPPLRRQRVLFTGLHLPAGTRDLFDVDGQAEDMPTDLKLPDGPGAHR